MSLLSDGLGCETLGAHACLISWAAKLKKGVASIDAALAARPQTKTSNTSGAPRHTHITITHASHQA
jgi:hypothetical protein